MFLKEHYRIKTILNDQKKQYIYTAFFLASAVFLSPFRMGFKGYAGQKQDLKKPPEYGIYQQNNMP
jgi:hypothetical protein